MGFPGWCDGGDDVLADYLQPRHIAAIHLFPVLTMDARHNTFHLIRSKFLIAVVLFGAVSMMAAAAHLWQGKPTDYPYHSWTSWAIDDFLTQKRRPQMVFMGSSLMLVPLSGVDADFLNAKLDGSEHHHSAYFEQEFAQVTGSKISTFNFALPGEMPSDAYLITDFLLTGKKRPNVIVYGVGPRDFMDNLLPSPAATDPFRFLSRFGSISNIASLTMPEWTERLNYELGQFVYLYGERPDICRKWSVLIGSANDATLTAGVPEMPREIVHGMIPEYKPFQLERKEAFFRPITQTELASFVDNLSEYRKRYKTLNMRTFLTQMNFFGNTLQAARQAGTHVVVVAMPITDLNRELIPDAAWNLYRNNLKSIATTSGASFVDFSESACFNRKDFSDTVHLHARGGRKFMDLLIERMADDQVLKTHLNGTPQMNVEVAGQTGGQL